MAKKKEEKNEKKKGFTYSAELVGLLLLLISIIGIGDFGPVGNIFNGFAIFLAGSLSSVVLIAVFFVGVYMLIKRKTPNFFTSRLIGFYILLIVVLALAHHSYVHNCKTVGEVFENTINNISAAFNSSASLDTQGGIIGAVFAVLFFKLFADGDIVVISILAVFGFVMLFNVSLSDLLRNIIKKTKAFFIKIKKQNEEADEPPEAIEPSEKDDDKIVISSLDQLTQVHDHDHKMEPKEVTLADDDSNFPMEDNYQLPPIDILDIIKNKNDNTNQNNVRGNIETLERVLKDFDISGKVVEVHVGPSVTQYELEIKAGTKVNKVLGINREIALALAAKDVRIQAPIPGKNTIGIEIPNRVNSMVSMREVFAAIPTSLDSNKLVASLGKDIMGKTIYVEINKTPHLLIAGATGSGKSVCTNTIICSILMRAKPDEVKLLLVDPKKVEFSVYNGIPHLLAPVVTDPKKASVALIKIVSEMDHRYAQFDKAGVKSIAGYNDYIDNKNKHLSSEEKLHRMPYIVVIIDELADLMLVAAKEVEDSILRITQLARAAGIHLIVATQRPSTDVITGLIKANLPSRIAFAVSSNVDSRTILDMGGAEKLLGKGDMLFLPMGESMPIRLQGSFISDNEVKRLVDWSVKQQQAKYDDKLMLLDEKETQNSNDSDDEYDEPMYNDIVEFAIRNGKISASLIQRKYRFGYNRAARVIDLLEERGIIGPSNGSKPREVLVKLEDNADDE